MQVVSSLFTTIVKVKFNERRTNFKAYGIQIQRLLKLNLGGLCQPARIFAIQIQRLLKLNIKKLDLLRKN